MFCQRLVLVGDAHLGRGSPEVEQAFLAFLDAVPTLGDGLVVTGDLFEFWFTYERAIPRRGQAVVAALAALRRRLPILMVGGNHDRWGGRFWEELGIEFAAEEARFELADRRATVLHGDGVTESRWAGRLLQRITRHPATVAVYRAIHPDLGLWLVDRLSGVLGERLRTQEEITRAGAHQLAWAVRRLEQDPSLALLAMGHTHWPAATEVGPGRWYVNPGPWFDRYHYAVVAAGKVELRQFAP